MDEILEKLKQYLNSLEQCKIDWEKLKEDGYNISSTDEHGELWFNAVGTLRTFLKRMTLDACRKGLKSEILEYAWLDDVIKYANDTLEYYRSLAGLAPIGHVVNVAGVKEVPIHVGLNIEYKEGYSFEVLKEPIENAIEEYFSRLRQAWASNDSMIVRISQIEYRLLELDGIFDLKDTTLNGQELNIVIDRESIPVRGEIIA